MAWGIKTAVALAAMATVSALGQAGPGVPYLLTDLEDAPPTTLPSRFNDIGLFAALGDRCVFFADDGWLGGAELWVSDGTEAGTRPLLEFDERALLDFDPIAIKPAGAGRVAILSGYGRVAFTDGTREGTVISPPMPPANELMAVVGGKAFVVTDRVFDETREVWVTDGTEAGTRLLGTLQDKYNRVMFLAQIGDFVYFRSGVDWDYDDLWVTNGTTAGTQRLLSARVPHSDMPGAASPDRLFKIANANQLQDQWNLVVHVPSTGETRITRLPAGRQISQNTGLVPLPDGRRVLIGTTEGILVSDGTAAGTAAFLPHESLQLRPSSSEGSFITMLDTPAGRRSLFWGYTPATGGELWITDGTPQGTRILFEAFPGPGGVSSQIQVITGTEMWFSVMPNRMYRTDGTPEGTVQVSSVIPRSTNTRPMLPKPDCALAGGKLFFRNYLNHPSALVVSEQVLGETLVIQPPGVTPIVGSKPGIPTNLPGGTVFTASNLPDGLGLYRTDGTVRGTRRLLALDTLDATARYGRIERLGDTGWFGGVSWTQPLSKVWKTDGTAEGTFEFASFARGGDGAAPAYNFFEGGDGIIFDNGPIYTASPDEVGTVRLAPGMPVRPSRDFIFGPGGDLYLQSNPEGSVIQLNRINLRTGVSTALSAVDESSAGGGFTRAGNRIGYFVHRLAQDHELWSTDGTSAGTRRLAVLGTGSQNLFKPPMVALGDRLITIRLAYPNQTLISVDPATGVSRDLATGPQFKSLAVLGNRVIFLATNLDTGTEPWVTDGTPEGTRMLRDTMPGPEGAMTFEPNMVGAYEFAVFGDRAYFASRTADLAPHVWVTDGTTEGTRPFGRRAENADVQPIFPYWFAMTGNILTFSAFTPAHGREMFAIRLCPADFDGNGFIDGEDYAGFVDAIENGTADADMNGDGFLDFFDYLEYQIEFETSC